MNYILSQVAFPQSMQGKFCVINIVFKFIPFRLGVDEAGTGMLAKALGFTPAIGASLAIVRKARDLFWTAVGVALIVRRGLSLKNLDRVAEGEAPLEAAQ